VFGSGPILKPTGPRPIRNSTTGRGAVYVPLTLRPGHVRNPTACALGGDRAGRIWNSTAPPSPIRNPTDKLLMTGAGAGSGPIRNPTVPRPDAEPDRPGNHDRAGPFKSSPSRCGVLLPTFGAVPRPESVGAFHPAVTHAQLRITDPDLHYYYQSTPDDD